MKIINTGCSYGVIFRSLKEFTSGSAKNFEIIDLHCDSHGAEYQKRSIIYTVNKLINNGINPTDIFVVCEFSQPNRLLIELPVKDADYILSDKDHSEGTFILDNKFRRNPDSYDYVIKHKSLNAIFGDRVYINPELDDFSEYSFNHKYYLKSFNKNSIITHKPIDRYESYITNIIATQTFLKSLGIDYVFFLMNNVFEGFINETMHVYTQSDIRKILMNDAVILPNLKNYKKIYDFSSYLAEMWNLIDFSKFVFYKTDRFNFGGIDEYAMEKFGNIAYLSAANPWDIPEDKFVMSFGAHPHDSVYVNFFIDFIYDRLINFIGDLTFDFSDRWSSKKHNAIRSAD